MEIQPCSSGCRQEQLGSELLILLNTREDVFLSPRQACTLPRPLGKVQKCCHLVAPLGQGKAPTNTNKAELRFTCPAPSSVVADSGLPVLEELASFFNEMHFGIPGHFPLIVRGVSVSWAWDDSGKLNLPTPLP